MRNHIWLQGCHFGMVDLCCFSSVVTQYEFDNIKLLYNIQTQRGVPHFIVFHFTVLCRYVSFYKLKICGSPALPSDG